MTDNPADGRALSATDLRLRAATMVSYAAVLTAYATLAVGGAVYVAVDHPLLLDGVGTGSLAWLVWWSFSGIIAGAGAVIFTAMGAALRGLAASTGHQPTPGADGGEPSAVDAQT